jgi:ketosteroid isomerase-like protein
MNEDALRELIGRLSSAFRNRDLEALLEQFSSSNRATYAGSETGETATGPVALRRLFRRILARPASYSFDLPEISYAQLSRAVWVLADGSATEHHPEGPQADFPYRITGVLELEHDGWRWALVSGCEPTDGVADQAGTPATPPVGEARCSRPVVTPDETG